MQGTVVSVAFRGTYILINLPICFHSHDVLQDLTVGAQQIFVNKDEDLLIRLFKNMLHIKKNWCKFQLTINYLF